MTERVTERIRIAIKYNWMCHWCNAPLRAETGYQNTATIDHYVPVSKGGQNTRKNYRASCHRCNQYRGSMNADQFLLIARTYEFDNNSVKNVKHANNLAKFTRRLSNLNIKSYANNQQLLKTFGPKWAVNNAYSYWINNTPVTKKSIHYLEYVAFVKIKSAYGERPTLLDKLIFYFNQRLAK